MPYLMAHMQTEETDSSEETDSNGKTSVAQLCWLNLLKTTVT